VKRLLFVTLTGALLATAFTNDALAKDKGKDTGKRAVVRSDSRDHDRRGRDTYDDDRRRPDYRHDKIYRADRRFRQRDIVVVREYYRPYYRPVVRDVRYVYVRHKNLPPGWQKKIRPVPVYVERDLEPIPYGYRRGIIDGHLVVHNDRGFIFDIAVLF
jgi:hypothetical protein